MSDVHHSRVSCYCCSQHFLCIIRLDRISADLTYVFASYYEYTRREDEVVPFWHAPRLLGIIPPEFRAQPFYVDGMGHNHIESQCRDRYISEMTNFLIMGVQNGCRKSDGDHHLMRSSARLNLNGLEAIETKENHPSFYINKTWLRHAQVLLKEVFFSDLGGMCHIHQSSVSNGDNDSKWKGGSTSRSSGSRSSHLSDARDEDNEFSPWTGGVGSKHPPQSPRNVQTQQHQQQRQVRMQSGKILTPRSIGTSNNNNPVSVASRGSPRYHQKSQPMKSNLDVSGRQHHRQQTRRFSTSDMKISSPRAQHHASSKQRVTLSKEVSNQRRSHC